MIKFNEEMLSRVLTAHVNGGLVPHGRFGYPGYPGCLFQMAMVADQFGPTIGTDWNSPVNGPQMEWFDDNYDPNWSVETFMKHLAEQGIY